jgi:WD40 repeat protein/predicted Ser/Thr protein kinase
MTTDDDTNPANTHTHPEVFGYDIQRELARGGQGVIYLANQRTTGQTVAIKVLSPQVSGISRQARERMAREIQIAGSLNHPGIVRIFDSLKLPDGRDALIMEHIEGDPLSVWMTNNPGASEHTRLHLLAKIADATHHAHQHGVIHRDLKPSNILIDHTGAPHLLDFGIAKRTGLTDTDPRITRTGEFSGTLAYAAPEQVSQKAGPPDIRTDIYALGIIGFELLTGHPPFDTQGSLQALVDQILTQDPPTRADTGISSDAWTVLAKAASKDKSRRYQSAAEMARDLLAAARGDAVLARADSHWYILRKTAKRHRAGLAIATLALLALAAVLVSLAIGNTRLASALRESRLLQIRAQLAVGSREQAERVLWEEINRDLPHDIDAPRALWTGSPREKELLWSFIEMQAPATCLDVVPSALSPALGLWPLADNTVLAARPDRTLVRIDPDDPSNPTPLGARVPGDTLTIKAVPSANFIVCIARDHIRTLDTTTARTIAITPFDAQDFTSIGIAVTEWGIVTNDASGNLTVSTLPELEPIYTIKGMPTPQTPWLDPHQRILAYITPHGTMRVLDLDTKADIPPSGLRILGRERLGPNPQLILSPDRTRYAVAYGGGMLVRAVTQNTDTEPLLAHPGYRVWVNHDPEWSMISAAANGDPTLHLWETRTWKPLEGLSGHHGSVISHAFLPDASKILTLDHEGTLRVWTAPDHGWRTLLGQDTALSHQIAAHPDTPVIYATDNEGTPFRFAPDHDPVRIHTNLTAVRAAIDDTHTTLALADMHRHIELHDPDHPGDPSATRALTLESAQSITALRFRPGSTTLAAITNPSAFVLIDTESASITRTIPIPSASPVSDLAWSPDGHHAALALRDGTIAYLHDPDNPEFRIIDIGARQIRSLVFTPDSASIAAVGDTGVLHLVDPRTGRARTTRRLSEHSLFSVAVHPLGRVALVGDRAGIIKAIDLADMSELATLSAGGSVMSMAFTDQGRSLAVSALDKPVSLWRFNQLAETLDDIRP